MIGDMEPVMLALPFRGRWLTQNSPARRVPSHGTDLFGITYAIDFVAVDGHGRSAPRTWRSLVATESPHLFRGFGMPILAPEGGVVVEVHDGEVDHEARRSQPTLLCYAVTQASRVRQGIGAVAGNHVVIALSPSGPYVGVVHLRRGSIGVGLGDRVKTGDQVGECGNSGNSTEPHVHVQVTDSVDWARARGLPLAFRPAGSEASDRVWLPREGEIVDAG
jgi:murein DD-endopeptidase MepM/ murein hydrolase activator NlpD